MRYGLASNGITNGGEWHNTSSAGGDANGVTQPHNHGNTGSSSNIPPYIAVYCWRRTK